VDSGLFEERHHKEADPRDAHHGSNHPERQHEEDDRRFHALHASNIKKKAAAR
jgi:hypothetical protein